MAGAKVKIAVVVGVVAIVVAGTTIVTVVKTRTHIKNPPGLKVADLGVVQVSNGGTNRVTSADGRVFVVRSLVFQDQKATVDGKETILKGQTIALIINEEEKDSRGVTRLLPEWTVGATAGQTVGISDGVTSIRITPQIKP